MIAFAVRPPRGSMEILLLANVFDTLALLAEHHGRLVEKDEFVQKLWLGRLYLYSECLRVGVAGFTA